MRKLILLALLITATLSLSLIVLAQKPDYTGEYIFKDYRKGKGGFENHLQITDGSKDRLHVSFELTYFYMAGKSETFHEGSAEGDGQLRNNILTATLSDGESGSCKVTLTFLETGSVSVKSSQCQINVVPDGVYKMQAGKSAPVGRIAAPRPSVPRTLVPQVVCPDPRQPCNSKARTFAPYEISFQLPGKLVRGKTYNSVPFYAVLIKSFAEESCDADDHTASIERERQKIQLAYPYNKVFAAYSCPNLDAVDYSFAGRLDSTGDRVLIMTFIAVYAGKTEAEGNNFLQYVRTVYRDAILKKMTASYEVLDQ